MKNIRNYATIKKNESVTNEPVLFTKQEVLVFLEKQDCPMDKIERIDWEACEYDEHTIEFHNPEEIKDESILLYMKNKDIQFVTLFIDSDFQLSGIHNQIGKFV